MKKTLILGAAIAGAFSSGAAIAVDGLSANVGVVSDYYYRGVRQTSGASGNGGVDYELDSGIYVGVWAADVGGQGGPNTGDGEADGIEIDTYAGYAGEAGDFGYSLGYTHYGYTGGFDTSYDEVNLGGSFGDFALDIAIGSHEVINGSDEDYTFTAVSYSKGIFSATYGTFSQDWDGAYIEVGMSTDIGGADAGVSIINGDPDKDLTGGVSTTDGTAVVFSLSKAFDL